MSKIAELAKRIYNKELFDLDTRFTKALGDASARWQRVHEATGAVQGAPADAVEDCERLYDEPHMPTWHTYSVPVTFTVDEVDRAALVTGALYSYHAAAVEQDIDSAYSSTLERMQRTAATGRANACLLATEEQAPLRLPETSSTKADGRLRGIVMLVIPRGIKRQRHFRRRLRALRDSGRLYDLNRWMLFQG